MRKYRNLDVDEYKNVWTRYMDDLKKNNIKSFEEWDQYRMKYEQCLKKNTAEPYRCLPEYHA